MDALKATVEPFVSRVPSLKHLHLVSVRDSSKGCDHDVYICSFEEASATDVVIKVPRRWLDKIEKQHFCASLCVDAGVRVPTFVYSDECCYVEEYVAGVEMAPSLLNTTLICELGSMMKRFHCADGAVGFCYHIRATEKSPCFDSWLQQRPIESINVEKLAAALAGEEVDALHRYIDGALVVLANNVVPCFLHFDVSFDNIIVDNDGALTLIDFGDAGMGDAMEDFAALRYLLSSNQLEELLEGYGGVSDDERKRIDLFCILRLSWALVDKEGAKRAMQMAAIRSIIQ